jgi:hypothetical protein
MPLVPRSAASAPGPSPPFGSFRLTEVFGVYGRNLHLLFPFLRGLLENGVGRYSEWLWASKEEEELWMF